MRWKEILVESVKKYLPMFSMFADDQGQMPAWVSNRIASVEALLKRNDRVVWALRWERLAALENDKPVRGNAGQIQRKILMDMRVGSDDRIWLLHEYNSLIRDHIAHWLSLPIAAIQNYVFDRQAPNEIRAAFVAAEEAWTKSRNQIINHEKTYPEQHERDAGDEDEEDEDDDEGEAAREADRKLLHSQGKIEKFLDFGNGWAWWDLNRSYCRVEGNAMGHCGNSATPSSGETVLSLRRDLGDGNYRPSLTFISDGGWLTEMKARANEKPAERYHAMITALLKDPRILGIRGGGHAPHMNFSVLDLPEEDRNALIAENPDLITIYDELKLVEEKPTEENKNKLTERLAMDMRTHGFRFKRIDFDGKDWNNTRSTVIVIKDFGSREDYMDSYECPYKMKHIKEFFADLQDNLIDLGIKAEDAEIISAKAYEQQFNVVFDSIVNEVQDEQYALDGVYIQTNGGHVVVQISISDYLNPSSNWFDHDDDDIAIYDRISSLDEGCTEKDYSWSDIKDNLTDLDELGDAIAELAFSHSPDYEGATRAVYDTFSEDRTGYGQYFSRHPDQKAFDFYKDGEDSARY